MSFLQGLLLVTVIAVVVIAVCVTWAVAVARRVSDNERRLKDDLQSACDELRQADKRLASADGRVLQLEHDLAMARRLRSPKGADLSPTPDAVDDVVPPAVQPTTDRSNHRLLADGKSRPEEQTETVDYTTEQGADAWASGDASVSIVIVDVWTEATATGEPEEVLLTERRTGETSAKPDSFSLREFLEDYVAGRISDEAWSHLTVAWQPNVDPAHAEVAATTMEDVSSSIHDLVLGEPVKSIGSMLGVPDPVTSVAADVADELPLPFDKPLRTAVLAVRVAAVVAVAAGGAPIFAIASVKSLAAHQATRLVTQAVGRLTDDLSSSADTGSPASEPDEIAGVTNRDEVAHVKPVLRYSTIDDALEMSRNQQGTRRMVQPDDGYNDGWLELSQRLGLPPHRNDDAGSLGRSQPHRHRGDGPARGPGANPW